MRGKECGIKLFCNTTQGYTLERLVGLQHPLFNHEALKMSDTFNTLQTMHQQVVNNNRTRFGTVLTLIIDNLDMTTKADDFLTHFVLKPQHNTHREYHHG